MPYSGINGWVRRLCDDDNDALGQLVHALAAEHDGGKSNVSGGGGVASKSANVCSVYASPLVPLANVQKAPK
jgi:hypothetical protein